MDDRNSAAVAGIGCPARSKDRGGERPLFGADGMSVPLVDLVASAEPAITFTSLAAVTVPSFADECRIVVWEEPRAAYEIRYPRGEQDGRGSAAQTPRRVRLIVHGEQDDGPAPAYRADITFGWHSGRGPTDSQVLAGRLLADQAAALISRERLHDVVAGERRTVRRLMLTGASNRTIGQAAGILMALHRCTGVEALELLQARSRRTMRTLHSVAADVVRAEMLNVTRHPGETFAASLDIEASGVLADRSDPRWTPAS